MPDRSLVVFDLGGVLIDWDPRYFYRKLFNGNEAGMEHFLATVCTQQWNVQQDAGRTFAEGCARLKAQHPDHAVLIDAWLPGYPDMLGGDIPGAVEILRELRERGVPVYAITNWSLETFPIALERFDFLQWFRGILVSGEVKLLKPDPRIFKAFLERFKVDPGQVVYIDDQQRNVDSAEALGMHAIRFTDSDALRRELVALRLLPTPNTYKSH